MKRCSYLADILHKKLPSLLWYFFCQVFMTLIRLFCKQMKSAMFFTKTAESLHCSLYVTTVRPCFSLLCYDNFCHKTIISQNYKSTLSKC